jgi:SAM-dependent methyltransferase
MIEPARVLELGYGFTRSRILLSAVELGVFTLLDEGALTAPDIGGRLGMAERRAREFLEALVWLELLIVDRDGRYSNGPEAALFLVESGERSVVPTLREAGWHLYPAWSALTTRLAPEAAAANDGHDPAARYQDPELLRHYLHAMTTITAPAAAALASAFPWSEVRSVLDVGTALGGVLATLVEAHPHLRGTGFDVDRVEPLFRAYIGDRRAPAERIDFVAGNFFYEALPHAEVVILSHILHDWDEEQKRLLVAKAYDALPGGGRLIVLEKFLGEPGRPNPAALMSTLNLLVDTEGGFEMAVHECTRMLSEAGFARSWCRELTEEESIVVGVR